MATIKTGWLKDNSGDKFAPKTLSSQVINSEGNTLESVVQAKFDEINALIENGGIDPDHSHVVEDITDIGDYYYDKTYIDENLATLVTKEDYDKHDHNGAFASADKVYTKEEIEAGFVKKEDYDKHDHDGKYAKIGDSYTKAEEDAFLAEKLDTDTYTTGIAALEGKIATDIEAHNIATDAHQDIRTEVAAKVAKADIVTNLETSGEGGNTKVLAASQGAALKTELDTLTTGLDNGTVVVNTATKLNSGTIGGETQPVYFSDGKPATTTYALDLAGENFGLVKSGGDVTIANGVITVNDDSHNHTIDNVDGLQNALDAKVPQTRTVNGESLEADITLDYAHVGALSDTDPVGAGTLSIGRVAEVITEGENGEEDKSNIGANSIALGLEVEASGTASFAEGYGTIASGEAAHAEGYSTEASGTVSHAEGSFTKAKGQRSHAEGTKTTALGVGSHAEGDSSNNCADTYTSSTSNDDIITDWYNSYFSLAKGTASHVEGSDCLALGNCSHAEGRETIASGLASHAEGGTEDVDVTTTASGDYSHAEGETTTASGRSSHSEGYYTTASGKYSHAEGNETKAEGQGSHSEGGHTVALGWYSHAEGMSAQLASKDYTDDTENDNIVSDWNNAADTSKFSLAKGYASHIEGENCLALGHWSHAEGNSAKAIGDFSHSEGRLTVASGEDGHAEGYTTTAQGDYSHSQGCKTTALGTSSHAEGFSSVNAPSDCGSLNNDTIVNNWNSATAANKFSLAKGHSAHVEGVDCLALGNYSHAEGEQTKVKGQSAHAEGGSSYANGDYSHAEGWNTFANGKHSHAEGQHSDASGKNSHAEGLSAYADSECQHVQGKYNVRDYDNKYAHIVGNGSSSARSNAHTLDWNGNAWFKGDVYIGGTSQDNTNAKKLQTAITGAATTVVNDNLSTSKVLVSDSSGKIAASSSITTTELGYLNNVTSNIQTQLNNKQGTISGAATTITDSDLTENRALISNGSGKVAVSAVTSTELGYLDGVSSNVQTQLNNKLSTVDPTGTGELSLNRKSDTVIGLYSVAIGYNTTASDGYTMATGYNTTASKSCSHAEGYETTASGEDSHSEGYKTTASGNHSHAEGWTTTASGESSHAEGEKTAATGYSAHAEGYYATASGNESHAEGYYTTALGKYSHAEGCSSSNVSSKYTSSTSNDTIIADWNTAQFSLAKGEASHVEGYNCLALGNYSHAEGWGTVALGGEAHAEGYQTTALHYQHALGYYNNTNTATEPGGMGINSGTVFVIGNGSPSGCSNAFRVNFNGTVYAQSSTLNTGADYAEYFEWQDSNLDTEDRRGYFVTLDGDKIKIAEPDDYILGIVSGQPAVIGNGDEDWRGRYILDEFGAFIPEEFEYEEEIHETVIDEETGEARVETKTVTKTGTKYKENPDYNPSLPYVQRADRPEWDAVGMMGVLSVRDDGTCQVNGYCKVAEGGIATASDSGYRVIKRINDHIVQVVFR